MYARVYELSEPPFELTADPRFLFLTRGQREALSVLQYGLTSSRSMTLLIGEAGTGKSMLLQAALASERCRDVRAVYLNNPTLRPEEFMWLLATRFNLGPEARTSKAVFLDRFEHHLRTTRAGGEITALVIDEAQAIDAVLLDEIRLLANMEDASVKLLPLVLAGQGGLAERLEDPSLSQVKQRVSLRCELLPMTEGETASYIASRIRTASGEPSRLFSREAVLLIHRHARGVPRVINVICHNALVVGMAAGGKTVDQSMVAEVCRDLHLTAGSHVTSSDAGQTAPSSHPAGNAPAAPAPDDTASPKPPRGRVASFTQLFRAPEASNE